MKSVGSSGSDRKRNDSAWRRSDRRTNRRCCRSGKSTWRRQRAPWSLPKQSSDRRRNGAEDDATIMCLIPVAVVVRVVQVEENLQARPRNGRRRVARRRRRAAGNAVRRETAEEILTRRMRDRRRRNEERRRKPPPKRRRPRLRDCPRNKRDVSCPRRRFQQVNPKVIPIAGMFEVAVDRVATPVVLLLAGREGFHPEAMRLVPEGDRVEADPVQDLGVCPDRVLVPDLVQGHAHGPVHDLVVAVDLWLVMPHVEVDRVLADPVLGRGEAAVDQRSAAGVAVVLRQVVDHAEAAPDPVGAEAGARAVDPVEVDRPIHERVAADQRAVLDRGRVVHRQRVIRRTEEYYYYTVNG